MSLLKQLITTSPPTGAGIVTDAFRKSHEIEGSTEGEQTDYQVKITVHKESVNYSDDKNSFKHPNSCVSPHTLYEAGTGVIIPYQDGTNIRVKIYDASTLAELYDYLVGADPISADGHGHPAIVKVGSHYILVYGRHYQTGTLKVSYSTDLENWTTYTHPNNGESSYPQLFVWTDGYLYMLMRRHAGVDYKTWDLYKCTDITNSGTWSHENTIIDHGDEVPYTTSRLVNGGTRLLLAWTLYTGAVETKKFMVAYTDDLSTWKDANGDTETLPLNEAKCKLDDLDYNVASAAPCLMTGYGDTFWFIPRWDTPTEGNIILLKKVIGGAYNTYDFGITGSWGELFYHSAEDYLKLFVVSEDGGAWKGRRYKFEDSTFTLEQTYDITDAFSVRQITGKTDWVYFNLVKDGIDANVNKLVLCSDTDIPDSEGDIYTGGKCSDDFGDIRFTLSDGTVLDYWMQEKVDGDYAIFWVEIPTIPADPDSETIRVYYGKAGESTTSDGDSTFPFFDDFAGASLDAGKWVTRQGSIGVDGIGHLSIQGTTGTRGLIDGLVAIPINAALHTRSIWNGVELRSMHFCAMRKSNDWTERAGDAIGGSGTNEVSYNTYDAGVQENSIVYVLDVTAYHIYMITWKSAESKFYQDDILYATHETEVPAVNQVAVFYEGITDGDIILVDWIFMRKWVDPEPAHGDWGAEEPVVWPF